MPKTPRGIVGQLGVALAGSALLFGPMLQLGGASPQPQSVTNPSSSAASTQRALLNTYCVTCHNERLRTAGLALDKMDLGNVAAGAEVWEKVLNKVKSGTMPPAGMPRPDRGASDKFASWLETELDRAALAKPNPGRVAIHRLNQTEYTNAIRDLLAIDINGRLLLGIDDAGEDGFDNMAGSLTVSPSLVERYVSAARRSAARLSAIPRSFRPMTSMTSLRCWFRTTG